MKPILHYLLTIAVFLLGMVTQTAGAGLLMATTISTTDLDTSFDDVYGNNSKNLQDLYTRIFHSADFDELFEEERIDTTVYDKAVGRSSALTQPFQLSWTPNGSFSFEPMRIALDWVKVDAELSSYKVFDSWVGFLHKQGIAQPDQSLTKYILNELILPQHLEDMEISNLYAGVYAAPTPGTAGAVGTSMNGLKVRMNTEITAGFITPISLGAIPTDPELLVQYVEALAEGIDLRDRDKPMTLAMSKANETRFKNGMRTLYNLNYSAAELNKVYLHQNIMVKGYAAVGTSDKMWCTPQGNAKKPWNTGPSPYVFSMEGQDRIVKCWADYGIGLGWIDRSRVYTNPEEL